MVSLNKLELLISGITSSSLKIYTKSSLIPMINQLSRISGHTKKWTVFRMTENQLKEKQ